MECTFDADGSVRFSGRLTELTDMRAIESALKAHLASRPELAKSGLRLSFENVTRANSTGIVHWLTLTNELKTGLTYFCVPTWMVDAFNTIFEFAEGGARVESFFATFYDPQANRNLTRLLVVGVDVLLNGDQPPTLVTPPPGATGAGGEDLSAYEPEFEPELYFDFLTRFATPAAA